MLEVGHVAGVQAEHAEVMPAALVAACADLSLALTLVFDFLLEGTRPGFATPVTEIAGVADVDGLGKRARGIHDV
jgi:hypothetical protein